MINVILIPVYKTTLTAEESFSLKACLEVLGGHDIVFVAPDSLNLEAYYSICQMSIRVERFDDSFFKSISGYNTLLLSSSFYQRFLFYDYMLIYQLDCYVFKDELEYWTGLGYDYIGAPWLLYGLDTMGLYEKLQFKIRRLTAYLMGSFNKMHICYRVGNGGFSLRNIKVLYEHLKMTNSDTLNKYKSDDSFSLYNEDVYWSLSNGIRKPNYTIGCRFSLESFPEIGMRFNKGELPFGCHAWKKEFHFWSKYISFK
jgi:hypothetical protein